MHINKRAVGLVAVVLAVTTLLGPLLLPSPAGAAPPPEASKTALYRLFNPVTGAHYYTTSAAERNSFRTAGWSDEHIAGFVLSRREAGHVPFYRLFHPGSRDWLYTWRTDERDHVIKNAGYQLRGIAGYVMPRASDGTTPLYRLFSGRSGKHFYTIFNTEAVRAEEADGYTREGDGAHVYQSARQDCPGEFVRSVVWKLERDQERRQSDHWTISVTPSEVALRPGQLVGNTHRLWEAMNTCVPGNVEPFPYWGHQDRATSTRQQLECHDLGATSGTWDLDTRQPPNDGWRSNAIWRRTCDW